MKKILYATFLLTLLLGVSFVMWGCEDDNDVPLTTDSNFLSKSASQEVDPTLMREAINRLDTYVEFHDGKFIFRHVTAAELSMSEDLFLQLQEMLKMSNEAIKG